MGVGAGGGRELVEGQRGGGKGDGGGGFEGGTASLPGVVNDAEGHNPNEDEGEEDAKEHLEILNRGGHRRNMGIEGKGNSESNVEMEARDMRREPCSFSTHCRYMAQASK